MLLLRPEKQPQLIPTGQAPSQPKPQAVNMLIRCNGLIARAQSLEYLSIFLSFLLK